MNGCRIVTNRGGLNICIQLCWGEGSAVDGDFVDLASEVQVRVVLRHANLELCRRIANRPTGICRTTDKHSIPMDRDRTVIDDRSHMLPSVGFDHRAGVDDSRYTSPIHNSEVQAASRAHQKLELAFGPNRIVELLQDSLIRSDGSSIRLNPCFKSCSCAEC